MNNVNVFAGRADILVAAIFSEKHPAVIRILSMNAGKIHTWAQYASFKKFARNWVSIEHRAEMARKQVVSLGFDASEF